MSETKLKYNVGDKVRVKSKEWWNSQEKTSDGSVKCGSENFTPRMTAFCGQIVMIKEIMIDAYLVEGDSRFWTDEMFEGYTFESKSRKNDRKDGKVRMDLLPWPELEKIAEVYTAGAKKYGDHNWENLENGYERYKGAMLRHLTEVEKGNAIDEDTGCLHIAQVAWNAIAMVHFKLKEYEISDNKSNL